MRGGLRMGVNLSIEPRKKTKKNEFHNKHLLTRSARMSVVSSVGGATTGGLAPASRSAPTFRQGGSDACAPLARAAARATRSESSHSPVPHGYEGAPVQGKQIKTM